MTSDVPADLAAAAALGGEMGRRFTEYDWAGHPLGPLSNWPTELRATVAVALTSRFPIVMWLGAQDLYLVYNDAYIPALGERHPAALGRPGTEVWWDIRDSIEPMLNGVTSTGTATWSADLLLPLVSGGRPVERYFTFSYSPLILADGRIDGVFCAVTETTERVLGERRLSALNELGAALMQTTTVDEAVRDTVAVGAGQHPDVPFVGVYVADRVTGKSVLRGASPAVAHLLPTTLAGLLHHARSDEVGASPIVIDDIAERLGLFAAFPEGAPERAIVIGLADAGRSPVGHLVVGLNRNRPLDEQYEGFCRLLADQVARAFVSARSHEFERQRADALAEIDRAKTAFLTNVSHEFRTPLTLLLGPLEDALAAVREGRDGDDQAERLEIAHRNARRLLRLVNSLLDFSRVESGRTAPQLVEVDIGELTAQIASSFAELCERAGLTLTLACKQAYARVDPEMWETIVLNLLSNAVKFTFSGSITVGVEPEGTDLVRICVADTGIGIPPSDLSRLFERFYRATNSRARSVEGSGIGLSLVRSLVEGQGGYVTVDSEVDVGTTVTIDLPSTEQRPRVPVPVSPAPPSAHYRDNAYVAEAMQWLELQPAAPGTAGRQLVLVVDDNADMRRHVQRILSPRWDTITAADGDSALIAVREQHPDLVVTDVMMPGTSGLDFVAALRADPEHSSMPVIMLSARAGVEAAGEGLAGGADDYLVKPFSSADLVNRVAARLEATGRELAARQRDEAEAQRTAALAAFGEALTVATSLDDTLAALLAAPLISLDARSAAIGILDPEHRRIAMRYAGDLDAEIRDRYHVLSIEAPVPIADVVRSGVEQVIPDTFALDERYDAIVRDSRTNVRSGVIEPLRDSTGTVFGALALYWPRTREFQPTETEVIARAATMTAAAVTRILTAEREHRIAVDFQEHLLDLDLRSTVAAVAGIYQPAAETMRVGGDWYLAIGLDTDRVGISVGDVVGHGLPAATVMSRLRSASAAAALIASQPNSVLDIVERYAETVPRATCATVAYAVVDGAAQTIEYACAGHPYPLLVPPDGPPFFLEGGRRPPLAARAHGPTGTVGSSDLPPGSLVVLYTDGLIERHGESLDDGLARLAASAVACRTLPVSEVCTALLAALTPPGGYTDDVALLAVRPAGTTATTFVEAIPPDPAAMPSLRHHLRAWLQNLEPDPDTRFDILLTVGEAITNAIEHGRTPDGKQAISLEVFASEDEIIASVTDRGSWSADSSASRRTPDRGRGLSLIYGLCHGVDVVRSSLGTRVTLHHRRAGAGGPS